MIVFTLMIYCYMGVIFGICTHVYCYCLKECRAAEVLNEAHRLDKVDGAQYAHMLINVDFSPRGTTNIVKKALYVSL